MDGKTSRTVKVEHAYPPTAPKGWFERHQLLVMFVLTTIGGGAISTTYQYWSHILIQKRDGQIAVTIKERELQAAQRKSAREFLLEFQDAAEKRNYYAYRIVSHIEDIQSPKTSAHYKENARECLRCDRIKYRDSCEVWNLRRNYFERFLQIYVSDETRMRFFEKDNPSCVTNQFLSLHAMQNSIWMKYAEDIIIPPGEIKSFKEMRTKNAWDLAFIYDRLLEVIVDSPPNNHPTQ